MIIIYIIIYYSANVQLCITGHNKMSLGTHLAFKSVLEQTFKKGEKEGKLK